MIHALAAVALILLLTPPAGAAAAKPEGEAGRPAVHPTVYLTPADVERGRENAAAIPGPRPSPAASWASDEWAAQDDAWILAQVPGKGACFAYGLTGCPICGAEWGFWDKARASFDNPGHVTCDNGHVLPDAAHPDAGTGWVAPDGRIHYFVGSYNAWVIEKLTLTAAENLAYAYSLTGDERSPPRRRSSSTPWPTSTPRATRAPGIIRPRRRAAGSTGPGTKSRAFSSASSITTIYHSASLDGRPSSPD